jgi:hypothetical protein
MNQIGTTDLAPCVERESRQAQVKKEGASQPGEDVDCFGIMLDAGNSRSTYH